jgi:hypothetical protein
MLTVYEKNGIKLYENMRTLLKEYGAKSDMNTAGAIRFLEVNAPQLDLTILKDQLNQKRVCAVCGKTMNEGYCFDQVSFPHEYYCSDDCMLMVHTQEEYDELYGKDGQHSLAYWTEWEEEDDDE